MQRKALATLAFLVGFAVTPALGADAFIPSGQTVNIAATVTTARVQIRTSPSSAYVRVYNAGAVPVFVACGDVTVLGGTTTSVPVAGNGVVLIGCHQESVAAGTSTTATVYFTAGEVKK